MHTLFLKIFIICSNSNRATIRRRYVWKLLKQAPAAQFKLQPHPLSVSTQSLLITSCSYSRVCQLIVSSSYGASASDNTTNCILSIHTALRTVPRSANRRLCERRHVTSISVQRKRLSYSSAWCITLRGEDS